MTPSHWRWLGLFGVAFLYLWREVPPGSDLIVLCCWAHILDRLEEIERRL